MKRVLIVKAGTAAAPLRVAFGDYDRWIVRALGGAGCRFTVIQAHAGERLPRLAGLDAVVVTGSPLSVTQGAPWMRRAGEYLREACEGDVAVLGICFGHQLLAAAYGARVVRNIAGREIGTVTCALTEAGRSDPLFDGVPPRFEVQATHEDVVEAMPDGAEILASNASTANQAFRIGDRAWGVQFHPELDAAEVKALVELRAPALEAEARERGEEPRERLRALLAGIAPTPWGRRILQNFVRKLS
jgi:GMP synthase (glutamine-hydrolysing)